MRVYLAVPLVSNRAIGRARTMAEAIRDAGHELTSPWNIEPTEVASPSALNVFKRDRDGSRAADVLVADATDPSTGVGMEVMAAYDAGRRVILVRRRGKRISAMLEHMDRKELLEYEDESEIYEGLRKLLR
jgi:nucleoside 2-deoxyribosyltransferase